ncbi:MAG: hypothetical protein SO360_01955 [Bifidobacterium tsurumiense]|uniref:hypothetical protein n=1 Tax=Bifidobacterium tsurumiense TaxID=356829 RepID=UPI002A7FA5E5|nr:hypothetical protein [Bifidobacterium tsurumiense]MDY4677617.1 hypothetical protein [Bifidobacterium tsurumiense]
MEPNTNHTPNGLFSIDELIIANSPEPEIMYLILGGTTHMVTVEDLEAIRDRITDAIDAKKVSK